MIKLEIVCVRILVLFLLLIIIHLHAVAQTDDAPVAGTVSAYYQAIEGLTQSNPSSETTHAFWRQWRDCFQKVIAENPQNESIAKARRELVALYNGLGEYDKSQTLLEEMISSTSKPDELTELYHQLRAISGKRYNETQDKKFLQTMEETEQRIRDLIISDPLEKELEAYRQANVEFRKFRDAEKPAPDVTFTYWRKWRDRLQKAIAENPKSASIRSAKRQLLGLYNGLSDDEKSQALLRELISEAASPEEKIGYYNESGTLSRMKFWESKEQSDLQDAQDAFEKANELFLSLPPEKQDGQIGGGQIRALTKAAEAAKDANEHEKSAALFRTARELFQSSPKSASHVTSEYFNLETLAELEMNQWIVLKKEADAIKCLEILTHLPFFRWPPSYYALQYATQWYGNNSQGFQSFVAKWLEKHAWDERTPILTARLGTSYFRGGQYDKALPIHETLKDKHRADFQRLEPDAFQQGHGGIYERILFELAQMYGQRGDRNKAENTKTELTSLLPHSTASKLLNKTNPSPSEDFSLPERSRYLVLRICCVVAGIMLILLGLYLAWTKEKK